MRVVYDCLVTGESAARLPGWLRTLRRASRETELRCAFRRVRASLGLFAELLLEDLREVLAAPAHALLVHS
jgi:hypothetical protein